MALAFSLQPSAFSSTVISATLTITNAPALTNATSGQKYTLNGDARTFTNSVASAATQIRVRTNDSAATILLSLVAQAGSYPFTGILSMTTSGGTNVTFRATNDTALVITLSPTNWGKVTYSTQTVGTVQTIVRVPIDAEAAAAQTNIINGLVDALNSAANTNKITAAKLDATLGAIAVGGTNVSPANLANSATVTWAKSGSNITATASGWPTNYAGFVSLTNGSATVSSANVATNSIILLSRYAPDGVVLPVNEVPPRILGSSFSVAATDTNDGVVFYQIINSGSASPAAAVSASYLAPTAYLRLDETNAMNVMVDVVGGQNFTNSAGVVSSVSGIRTNGYQLERPNSDDFIGGPYASATSYNFGTNDFAVRLWIRPHSTNANDGTFIYNDGYPHGWHASLTNSIAGQTNRVAWTAFATNTFTLVSTNNMVGDTWHRVVLWHKQGVELGLKVDNQPSETLVFTNLMLSAAVPWEWYVTGTGNRIDYDEIAVWKGYVPTSAELTYDWNSAAGRSYPLSP
jgi:hypothetical protein